MQDRVFSINPKNKVKVCLEACYNIVSGMCIILFSYSFCYPPNFWRKPCGQGRLFLEIHYTVIFSIKFIRRIECMYSENWVIFSWCSFGFFAKRCRVICWLDSYTTVAWSVQYPSVFIIISDFYTHRVLVVMICVCYPCLFVAHVFFRLSFLSPVRKCSVMIEAICWFELFVGNVC